MPLPYPTKVVLPFDIATAQDMNERHANDVALADGTGLDDESVTAEKTDFGGNYSTSEVDTGFTWVDGKTIYKKTVNFGSLPNNTTKTTAHGITGVSVFISVTGIATNGSAYFSLPYSDNSGVVATGVSGSNVFVQTVTDRTAYTTCYITLYYTK